MNMLSIRTWLAEEFVVTSRPMVMKDHSLHSKKNIIKWYVISFYYTNYKTIYEADYIKKTCYNFTVRWDFHDLILKAPGNAYYNGTCNIQGIETVNWRGELETPGEYIVYSFAKTDKRFVNMFLFARANQLRTDWHDFQNHFVQSIIPKRPDDKEFILPPFCK